MANRCKTVEGAQQCIKARHPKIKGHTLGPRGETKEWNGDGTPKTAPDLEAEARRRVAEEEARLRRAEAMIDARVKAAWFDPSPDAPTVTIPTINPNEPRPAVLSGADLMLAEIDQTADTAIREMGDRYLLDLALAELDHELAQFDKAAVRFVEEICQRMRFLDFAEAAAAVGHHPAAAYCYAADRFDPAVMA